MAQVGEIATPTAPSLPQRFKRKRKRKGKRNRRTHTPKPITTAGAYENPKQVAISYRMQRYGLSEDQAKDEHAATELGRLWLLRQISEPEREAGERYLELYEEHLRAIKAPVGLRKSTAGGSSSDEASLDYVDWVIGAVAKWKVFRTNSIALQLVVIEDQPVGGMLVLVELRLALQNLAERFGLAAVAP